MKTLLAGIFASLVASVALAESTPPAASLRPHHLSTFSKVAQRNPFLPIGYARKVESPVAPKAPEVRPDMFVVTAIVLGTPPIVIINGRDYTVGDRLPVPNEGSASVTIVRIEDGLVVLRHRDLELSVRPGRRR